MKTTTIIILLLLTSLLYLVYEQKQDIIISDNATYKNLNESNVGVYKTTKENYKLGGLERIVDPGYNGYCEKEIFNRHSQLKNDKLALDSYLSIFSKKINYENIEKAKQTLLINLKDEKLKESLKISFKGIDIALTEFPFIGYHCTPVQKSMRTSFIVFNIMFIILILGLQNIIRQEKKKPL